MPIGKNAIKRISNSGYSNVATSAPDMENSVVVEEKSTVAEKKKAPQKKTAAATAAAKTHKTTDTVAISEPKTQKKTTTASSSSPKMQKKPTAKKAAPAPKKSMESEPSLSPVNTAKKLTQKTAEASARRGDGYINIGGELPYYLL